MNKKFLRITSITGTKHLVNLDSIESISETEDGEVCIILNTGRTFTVKEKWSEVYTPIVSANLVSFF